jgi:hypothetical protein
MRPDQEKFDTYEKPFQAIDARLQALANQHGFQLERNLNRQPCRVLTKEGNPSLLVDLSYDDYWFETDYHDRLPLSVTAIAYYSLPTEEAFVWSKRAALAEHIAFPEMAAQLEEHLQRAFRELEKWDAPTVLSTGDKLANPAAVYGH